MIEQKFHPINIEELNDITPLNEPTSLGAVSLDIAFCEPAICESTVCDDNSCTTVSCGIAEGGVCAFDLSTQLPTVEEYREAVNSAVFEFTAQWSEPKYQCPKCGGGMCRNEQIVLTSHPPQYEYQCNKCGHIDYQYM